MLSKVEIGIKIRRFRVEQGKSQSELGIALGKSHAAVSDIENGKTDVTASDLSVIASFLRIPLLSLLEETTQQPVAHTWFRDAKNMTPKQKSENDESTNAFLEHINNLKNNNDK